jgi:type II secretory pathway pseudopilin PulG
MRRGRDAGFTLLDILVVMGVLGMLAAFFLAGLGPARKQASVSRCFSHLRQIELAYQMYLADYDRYPRPSAITTGFYLEDRRLLFCPEDTSVALLGAASSYRYRYQIPPDFRPLPELRELHPDTVLAICEHHLDPLHYPYHLVLRASGKVERVHVGRVRSFLLPGDHPAFMDAYPGEPGYAQAKG